MKFVAQYSIASFLFVAVLFSLLFMNALSLMMLRKASLKEEEPATDSYYFAGYELARS